MGMGMGLILSDCVYLARKSEINQQKHCNRRGEIEGDHRE